VAALLPRGRLSGPLDDLLFNRLMDLERRMETESLAR
jgi:hypothetical protein